MKKGGYRQTLWRPICDGCLRLFFTLILSAILLPLQSRGQAPVNLANLYYWTNTTSVGSGDDPNNYVFVRDGATADFQGGLTLESGSFVPVQPSISGTVGTVPGVTYEVSFTVQDDSVYGPNSAQIYFGDTYSNIYLPPHASGPGTQPIPVNIDFTAVATSDNTTMSFEFGLDPSDDEDSLYNLSVIEAVTGTPEASSEKLVVLFGCTWFCVKQWQRLLRKRT